MDYTEFKLEVRITSSSILQGVEGRKGRNMVYTVGEMARLLDVSASTLRYYDKEGLLTFVERSSGADAFCRNPFCRASQSIIPTIC